MRGIAAKIGRRKAKVIEKVVFVGVVVIVGLWLHVVNHLICSIATVIIERELIGSLNFKIKVGENVCRIGGCARTHLKYLSNIFNK